MPSRVGGAVRALPLVVVVATWLCLTSPVHGQTGVVGPDRGSGDAGRPPTVDAVLPVYLDAVHELSQGDPAVARRSLVAKDRAWVSQAVAAFTSALRGGDKRLLPRDVEAAVVLHTEIALAGKPPAAGRLFHQDTARQLLQVEKAAIPRDIDVRCHLAMVAFWQREAEVDIVLPVLSEAVDRFGDDPDVLLALGSFWEMWAAWPGTEGLELAPYSATAPIATILAGRPFADRAVLKSARSILGRCATVYSRSLETKENPETRVRLGWVLHELGRDPEAAAVVRPVVEQRADTRFRYLAALVQSAALLSSAKAADGVLAARVALGEYPTCQTPRVALSNALRVAGEWNAAQELMVAMLTGQEGRSCSDDPWSTRFEGQAWKLERMLDDMERVVRR